MQHKEAGEEWNALINDKEHNDLRESYESMEREARQGARQAVRELKQAERRVHDAEDMLETAEQRVNEAEADLESRQKKVIMNYTARFI